jgi:integrase/recombinase XerD
MTIVPTLEKVDSNETTTPEIFDQATDRIAQFLKSKALAAKTQREYYRELHRFVVWIKETDNPQGWSDWQSVSAFHVADYKASLTPSFAPASVAQSIAALKSFFRWMVESGYLTVNPTLPVRVPAISEPVAQHFTEDEMTALTEALEFRGNTEVRDRAVMAALEHGLRVNEVCRLNVEDFDGERLTIHEAKHDSVGQVPLVSDAIVALKAYLHERQSQGDALQPDSPLFLSTSYNSKGKRLGYRGIYNLVRDLGEVAGIENCHPHRLRHTFATRLVLKGVDSYLARKLTRHRSENAFRRYSEHSRQQAAEQAFLKAFDS